MRLFVYICMASVNCSSGIIVMASFMLTYSDINWNLRVLSSVQIVFVYGVLCGPFCVRSDSENFSLSNMNGI